MHWDDEQFVKIYTRDTGEWTLLSWDAQALLVQILRKVDRSGVLQLGKHGTRVLAATLGHRDQQARILPALAELELDGCVLVRSDCLVVPNFIAAQTSRQSDKARQQAARDRRRVESMSAGLQDTAKTSQNVTDCHPASPDVTSDHPASPGVTLDKTRLDETRLDLSLVDLEPSQPELALVPQQAADVSPKPAKPTEAQVRDRVARALYAEIVAARRSVIAGARVSPDSAPKPAGLAGLLASLGQGYTPEQIRHAIKLKVAEVRADPEQGRWFVAKWFHPANIDRYSELTEADVVRVKGGPRKSPADLKREAELDAYFARQDRKHDAIEVASEETRRDF